MTALKDLLADPEQPISFLVELSYRNPATDVEDTLRITDKLIEKSVTPAGYKWGLLGPDKENPDVGPGGRYTAAEVDELGAGLQATPKDIVFSNPPHSIGAKGPLDFLRDLTLSGRHQRVLAGSPTEAISEWEDVGSGIAEDEPEFDLEANTVTLRLKSALGILDQDLDVNSYVGEPSALRTITSNTVAALPAHNSTYDLSEFTVAVRFKVVSFGSGAVVCALLYKIVSATNSNWNIRVLGPTFNPSHPNALEARYTSGGVEAASFFYDDLEVGKSHWAVFARRSGHVYLMVDGIIAGEQASGGTPNLSAAPVRMNLNAGTTCDALDFRILNHYITPDEARAWMAVRSSGTEQGLVGLWRGDDNGGNTLTDYSPTAAHATISGVEGTAFEWVSSDLGEEALTGQSMLAWIGRVWHGLADLVSSVYERWRWNDRPYYQTMPPAGLAVRDEGELLDPASPSFDYTVENDSVIALAAEAGEPLTAGLPVDPFIKESVEDFFAELLVERGPLTPGDYSVRRLSSLFTAELGIQTRRRSLMEIVNEQLRGLAAYATVRRDGLWAADMMLPPVSPGVRGERCIEIASGGWGGDPSGIEWQTGASLTDDTTFGVPVPTFTACGFFKLSKTGPSDIFTGDVLLMRLESAAGGDVLRWALDADAGVPRFRLESFSSDGTRQDVKTADADAVPGPDEWWFLAVSNEQSGEVKFYACRAGDPVKLIGTAFHVSVTAFEEISIVQVGGDFGPNPWYQPFRGGVEEPRVYNTALSIGELNAIRTGTGETLTPTFRAPLNGLSAAALTDAITSTVGVVTGDVSERPNLVVDLRKTPRPWNEKRLRPARWIGIHYRENYARLDPEAIAVAVPRDQRLDLQLPHRTETWPSPTVADDYKDARDVEIHSPWHTKSGAESAMRLARHRFGEGRYFAALGRRPGNPLRQGLLLEVGDEVRVYGHGDLTTGPTYRVASNRATYNDLDCELGLWR